MKKISRWLVPVLMFWCAAVFAADSPITLEKGNSISAPGSSALAIESVVAGASAVRDVSVPAFRDKLVFNDVVLKAIGDALPANPAAVNTLLLRDAAGRDLKRFAIAVPAEEPEAIAETPRTRRPAVANRTDCRAAATDWKKANPEDWNRGKDVLLVLFNRDAKACYESTQFAREGDTVYVGIVATDDDAIESASVQFSQCSREPVEPNIYISGDPRAFITQSGGFKVQIVEVRRCWDKEITLTVNVKPADHDAAQGTRPMSFYEVFRGTLQFGALYTDLHENDFGLRDSGGQNIIYNKEADEKGPEYVASLVVYGFPNYFTSDGWKKGYRGRDILNEHKWTDRTGLLLMAGLDDPSDRFGVGLSFELAYGINVFVTKQWFRQKNLVGLAEGDVFAGEASAITTKRDWETDTSFGLSFDIRYITALFQGK